MIGLIMKDILVFKKSFNWIYRLASAILLIGAATLFPDTGASYIALMLPVMGVAFLTEIVKVEEKSDWKGYLPVLPITNREIVLSKYIFSGILLIVCSVLSFALCSVAAILGNFAFESILSDYIFGVCFATFVISFGIPGGFLFKNESCTGAMIQACMLAVIARFIGINTLFFGLEMSAVYVILVVVETLIMFISYRVALWIYSTKRYAKINRNVDERK